MSFSISVGGHIEPLDPEKDGEIIRACISLCDALDRAGIPYSGTVSTPSSNTSLPPAIRVGKLHADSATPTGHKPK